MIADDRLAREVRRLVDQVSHWTPSRWAASSASGVGSRADAVHALAQELADRAAVAEGEPRRAVPRLPHDAALADQIRVLAADLAVAASGDALVEAADLVLTVRRGL